MAKKKAPETAPQPSPSVAPADSESGSAAGAADAVNVASIQSDAPGTDDAKRDAAAAAPPPAKPDIPEPVVTTKEEADKVRAANAFQVIKGEPDRRRYIGGSDVAALMGVAPEFDGHRDTPLTTYFEKISTGGESAMPPDKKLFLERRKRWEGPIFEMLKEEFHAEIVSVNRRLVDPELSFIASEIDFEWLDPETGLIENGEVKTVSPFAFKDKFGWGEPGSEDVPIHYYFQCQHGLGVTGRRKTILAALVGLDGMHFYPIARNEETIADMRHVCYKFWMEHVLRGVPPDPMSMGDLKVLFKTATKELQVAADSTTGSKALHLRAIRAQQDALDLEAIALEFDVKLSMKDAEILTVDGRKVWSWKEQSAGTLLQVAELKASKDPVEKAVYRKYLKDMGTRRVFKAMYGS